jgi:hypothetical protein
MKRHTQPKPKKSSRRAAKPAGAGKATRPAPAGRRKSSRKSTAVEEPWPAAAQELRNLRSGLDQTLEQVGLRLGAQITQLLSVVDNEPEGGVKPPRLSAKVVEDMVRRVRAAKLKPRKGRIKDLARVQELLEKLAAILPPQE